MRENLPLQQESVLGQGLLVVLNDQLVDLASVSHLPAGFHHVAFAGLELGLKEVLHNLVPHEVFVVRGIPLLVEEPFYICHEESRLLGAPMPHILEPRVELADLLEVERLPFVRMVRQLRCLALDLQDSLLRLLHPVPAAWRPWLLVRVGVHLHLVILLPVDATTAPMQKGPKLLLPLEWRGVDGDEVPVDDSEEDVGEDAVHDDEVREHECRHRVDGEKSCVVEVPEQEAEAIHQCRPQAGAVRDMRAEGDMGQHHEPGHSDEEHDDEPAQVLGRVPQRRHQLGEPRVLAHEFQRSHPDDQDVDRREAVVQPRSPDQRLAVPQESGEGTLLHLL
mmetsp:Transcript_18087/g.51495  ORF Transcript_18087/g.51495 Transcript_18087/m.51495 type:complete len:335 (+) Transcript_18087:474-1478(+)